MRTTIPLAPPWLVNHLADGTWAYALAAFVELTWSSGPPLARTVWLVVAFAAVIAAELAQLLHAIPGTFDFTDLVVMGACFCMASWLTRRSLARTRLP